MLTSLFGEFGPRRLPAETRLAALAAATAVDSDVVFDGDVAHAMRSHLDATRADLGRASSMITLLDPSGIWAPQVIRALSDAGGQGIERLSLRERGTLRTMAVIERASVPRQSGDPLKVYHVERRGGVGAGDLSHVLAERSHLTAVVIGAMAPYAVTVVLRDLLNATRQPEWRCPWLVFIVPPGAGAMRRRILEQDWPPTVRTAAMSESLSGPAVVWNAVLTAWEAAASTPAQGPGEGPADDDRDPDALQPPQWLAQALVAVGATEGVLACGVVDLDSGDLLAADGDETTAAELRAMATAMCAARRAHLAAGGPHVPPPDELLATMGLRQVLLRRLALSQALGCIALVERSRANLSLVRLRLAEAERQIG